jgi:hypothetical protein
VRIGAQNVPKKVKSHLLAFSEVQASLLPKIALPAPEKNCLRVKKFNKTLKREGVKPQAGANFLSK